MQSNSECRHSWMKGSSLPSPKEQQKAMAVTRKPRRPRVKPLRLAIIQCGRGHLRPWHGNPARQHILYRHHKQTVGYHMIKADKGNRRSSRLMSVRGLQRRYVVGPGQVHPRNREHYRRQWLRQGLLRPGHLLLHRHRHRRFHSRILSCTRAQAEARALQRFLSGITRALLLPERAALEAMEDRS